MKPDVLVPKLEKQSQSTNASNNLKKEPESLSSSQKPSKVCISQNTYNRLLFCF